MTALLSNGAPLLWVVFALATVLVLPVAWRLLTTARRRRTARHLARMRGVAAKDAPPRVLMLPPAQRRSVLRRLERLLARSGTSLSVRSFVVALTVTSVCIAIPAAAVAGPVLGGLAGLSLGAALPIAVLNNRAAKRAQAFGAQLPDALDLMMRGLRVGHPVSATIDSVADSMPAPLGTEFRRLATQIGHGDDLAHAFQDLAERIGQEDMDYLAVSIAIQHGTGGNLADMLATLSQVIRARLMLRRRVKALSSEGRISAMLLSSLPLVIYGATSLLAPDYYGAVRDHPLFVPIALVIAALVSTNFLVLRRLVRFEA